MNILFFPRYYFWNAILIVKSGFLWENPVIEKVKMSNKRLFPSDKFSSFIFRSSFVHKLDMCILLKCESRFSPNYRSPKRARARVLSDYYNFSFVIPSQGLLTFRYCFSLAHRKNNNTWLTEKKFQAVIEVVLERQKSIFILKNLGVAIFISALFWSQKLYIAIVPGSRSRKVLRARV